MGFIIERDELIKYEEEPGVTEITIPYEVKIIRSSAFARCTGLTSIIIPDSVKSIGDRAFAGCKSLTMVTLSNSITKIENCTFMGCASLISITIPHDVVEISNYAFVDCTSLISITLPDSVTRIGDLAFQVCTSLTSITIPDSVTKIGRNAFESCTSLTDVKIPDSVIEIGRSAFSYCSKLTSMTLPLAKIGEDAIMQSSVSKLTVIFPDGSSVPLDFMACLRKDDLGQVIDALRNGHAAEKMSSTILKYTLLMYQYIYTRNETIEKKFKAVIVKYSQYLIDENKAALFEKLFSTGLIDDRKLVKIEDYAKYKKNIKKIKGIITALRTKLDEENDTVPKKKEKSDKNCGGKTAEGLDIRSGRLKGLLGNDFKELVLPESVKNIDKGIFLAVKVKKLVLPRSLKKLTGQVFKDCTRITEVIISEGTETIGKEAFKGCTSLKAVTIPASATTIEAGAFSGCTKLKDVKISEGALEIGDSAFADCSALESIALPASVKRHGIKLFKNCKKLKDVTMPGDQIICFDECFAGCKKLNTLTFTAKDAKYSFKDGIVVYNISGAAGFIAPGRSVLAIPESVKSITVETAVKELTVNVSKEHNIEIKTTSVNILNFIHNGKTYTFDITGAKEMLAYTPFDYITIGLYPRKKEATIELVNAIVDIIINGDIESYTNYCYEAFGEVCYSDGYENTPKVEPLFDLRKQLSEVVAEIHGIDSFKSFSELIKPVFECYEDDGDIEHLIGNGVQFFGENIEYFDCLSEYPEMQKRILCGVAEAMISRDDAAITTILDRFNQVQIRELIDAALKSEAVNVMAQLLEYNNNTFGENDPL